MRPYAACFLGTLSARAFFGGRLVHHRNTFRGPVLQASAQSWNIDTLGLPNSCFWRSRCNRARDGGYAATLSRSVHIWHAVATSLMCPCGLTTHSTGPAST